MVLAPRVLGAAVQASLYGDQILAQIVNNAAPRVAARAAWLASIVGGPRTASALEAAMDGPRSQRIAAAWALGQIGSRGQAAVLERATRDADVDVQEMAGFALEMLERRYPGAETAR